MGRKRLKKEVSNDKSSEMTTSKANKTQKSSKASKSSKTCEFKCSECMDGFEDERQANDHIFKEHYGLARLNDDSKTPFTESEIIKALIKAQKVMKVLKCKNSGCDKSFRSGLGLKMHWDLCGKSENEVMTNCEVCDKRLKISSMAWHMKNHSTAQRPELPDQSDTEEETPESTVTNGRTRKRKSALRAQRTIRNSTKGEVIISGSVSDSELKSDSDQEFKSVEPMGEKAIESPEPTETTITIKKQSIEQNLKKVLNLWKEFLISIKDFLREIPRNLFQKWNNDLLVSGKVFCPLKGCSQQFSTRDGLKYHYQRCGIDFKFSWKCKVCGFEVSKGGHKPIVQHLWKNHKDSLPELPSDLLESIETAGESVVQMSKTVRDSRGIGTVNTVLEFHERYYKQKSFPNLFSTIQSWILLTEDEHSIYIPNPNPSAYFTSTLSDTKAWNRLDLFESLSTKNHINFFVGGPVWSSAWCPLPLSISDSDQFVAIASNMNFETTHTLNDTDIEIGLIQVWNVGKLNKLFDASVKPKMAFSIAHCCGMIWDMEWCPGGTAWADTPFSREADLQVLPRLGLLAIACGDGFIRVHSIPYPQTLCNAYENPLYYNEPILILNPPGVGNSVNFENTICKCLSWIKSNDQHLIVGGYGSGVIAVWDLTTASSLLIVEQNLNQTVLRPLHSWVGHSAAVNQIKWLSNSSDQFLISCAFDRSAKLWNLKDLTVPITTIKKGLFTAIDAHMLWNGMFMANDDCYLGFQNNTIFKDFGFFNFSAHSVSAHKSCIWDLAVSEWTTAGASVDAAGEAVIFPSFLFKSEQKRKPFDRIPLYHIRALPLHEITSKPKTAKTNKSKQNNNNFDFVIDPKEPPLRSYSEYTSKYGLVFNDYDLTNFKAIPIEQINRIRLPTHMQYQRLSDYPLLSLNRVCWNPNFTSCTWILTTTQSGICRLSCVSFLTPTLNMNSRDTTKQ